MTRALATVFAAAGAFHLYTARLGWPGLGSVRDPGRIPRPHVAQWLVQAGLTGVRTRDLVGACVATGLATTLAVSTVLGPSPAALLAGAAAAGTPVTVIRRRRHDRRQVAQEAWPRLIEEIRVQTGSLGRSIPQALFEVGSRAPVELRSGFTAAQREWSMTTDLESSLALLKDELADPTADAACETLLVAHEVGGSDLDRRLHDLAEDRMQDLQGRKDARARQAGARFARRFVLLTPAGMALAGMSVGDGRAAYATPTGQALSLLAVGLTAACWWWASRILHLPRPQRVFP